LAENSGKYEIYEYRQQLNPHQLRKDEVPDLTGSGKAPPF
jgi:hypothetical protein